MAKIKTPNFHRDQVLFTSDLHFGHKFVADYRGYDNIDDHDYAIIDQWNKIAELNSVIYILGDVSFRKSETTSKILRMLKGELRLVRGNHDKRLSAENLATFTTVDDIVEIDVVNDDGDKQRITMCHYQMLAWNRSHYGAWQLFGHSHGSAEKLYGKQLDVGVDAQIARQLSDPPLMPFKDIELLMNHSPIHTYDHHEAK